MLPTSKLKIWSRQMRLYKWHIKNRKKREKGEKPLKFAFILSDKSALTFLSKNLSIKKPLSAVNEHQVTIEPNLVVQIIQNILKQSYR
jgi:hypothetical protein